MLERALRADSRKGVAAALKGARKRFDDQAAEEKRLRALYAFEQELASGRLVLGLDEVGRGSVAGPLAVGAVVLPAGRIITGLDDSKKISPHKRERIAQDIKDHALAQAVCYIEAEEIDAAGMSACLRIAFLRAISAIEALGVVPEHILLDGNALGLDAREINVVKGDARCASIAAASILAKVERDALMTRMAASYPPYGFDTHKGYASSDHIEAIRKHGLSPQHRKSFCTAFLQESLF